MHIAQAMGGYLHLHARMCRCAPCPYLGNDCTDCAGIWCVVGEALARRFKKSKRWAQLDVRTCAALSLITAGRIALKFGCSHGSLSQKIAQKLRVGTAAFLFLISGSAAGRNALKLGYVVRGAMALRFNVFRVDHFEVLTCAYPFFIL